MDDLKGKTIRGGMVRVGAQAANFFIRLGSLMILARLLEPRDFGLVGMATAVTGILSLFRDFGLSSAAVQRANVTDEQLSTLFWINVAVGCVLGVVTLAIAPALSAFYHEPRLNGVTAVLAVGFLFNAAGVQHGALLQREMRFTALAIVNTVSLVVATAIAIGGAGAGYGYWSLAVMTITIPTVNTIGLWLASGWVPGMPHRNVGVHSMARFGGAMTLNGLIVYMASNSEKVLLGRFWGADALGLYGRAYQLINVPTENLNTAAGEVAFSALSRLQEDPRRLRSYFLKGYSLILAFTLPLTIACGLFAADMIIVFLGQRWTAAAPIFRWLAPTIFTFAVVNPLAWLLCALGRVGRLLKMGLVIAPVMIVGYAVGLPYGPKGVACAYSVVMIVWILPAIRWCVHGTVISFGDVLRTLSRPLASSVVAGAVAFLVRIFYCGFLPAVPRLGIEITVLVAAFGAMLFFISGDKSLYLDLFDALKRSKEKNFVSA